MSGRVQERQKAPWLWFDVVYNLTLSGQKHHSALDILHGFTDKVYVFFLSFLYLIHPSMLCS